MDREVSYVQAEDPSGRFGILPGHEPYLTALVPSILVYRYHDGEGNEKEAYFAVRQGILRVTPGAVQVAVRDAYASEELTGLEGEVREARRRQTGRSYRSARSLYQMQIAAWRRIMEYEDARTRQG